MYATATRPSFLATRRGKLILALVCIAAFLHFLDASIVNTALPSIRGQMHFSIRLLYTRRRARACNLQRDRDQHHSSNAHDTRSACFAPRGADRRLPKRADRLRFVPDRGRRDRGAHYQLPRSTSAEPEPGDLRTLSSAALLGSGVVLGGAESLVTVQQHLGETKHDAQ